MKNTNKSTITNLAAFLAAALPMSTGLLAPVFADVQIADVTDTLDNAVKGPRLINGSTDPYFDIYAADHEQFDSNVFRLSSNADVKQTVGPSASREDHINIPSAGLDGQWSLGRQIFSVEAQVADNRYSQNTNLNNVSSIDKAAWNWGLGSVLSGQIGAEYTHTLLSFVNAAVYDRNTYQQTQYFASGRYQVGPRWALYGGVLDTNLTVEDPATSYNDFHRKAVDMGAELETSPQDSFGVDYRYTDARYPNAITISQSAFDPDYREDRLRFLAKRVLTDKTTIDLSVGELKRTYANSIIGSFSGPIWRGALGWAPTDKTQLIVAVWRDLQAYLTDASNYYRTTAESIAPTWTPSEKISLSIKATHEDQRYIGSSSIVPNQLARHDTYNSQVLSLAYTPIRALVFDLSYGHEQRGSNQPLFSFNDRLATAGVKFIFQ